MSPQGLGAIMAQAQMARDSSLLENGEGVRCPLCGYMMEPSGIGYFCYDDGKPNEFGSHHPCVEKSRKDVFEAFERQYAGPGAAYWEWQGTVIGAIVKPGETPEILAELRTVRGPRGKTNMSLTPTSGMDITQIPSWIKEYGWTFMDWVPVNK